MLRIVGILWTLFVVVQCSDAVRKAQLEAQVAQANPDVAVGTVGIVTFFVRLLGLAVIALVAAVFGGLVPGAGERRKQHDYGSREKGD